MTMADISTMAAFFRPMYCERTPSGKRMSAPASVGRRPSADLAGREVKLFRDEWTHGAVEHPDSEAEIEVEKGASSVGGCPDFRKALNLPWHSPEKLVRCWCVVPAGSNVVVASGLALRLHGRRYRAVASNAAGLLYANRALLEVGFARDGIECSESDKIRVGLGEVEGHEDLAWSDDAGDAQLQVGNWLRRETHGDTIVRPELRRRRPTGFISSHALGTMLLSMSTCAVLVRVCQCSTVRPVLRMKVYSLFGCSVNGSHGTEMELGASIWGGEDTV